MTTDLTVLARRVATAHGLETMVPVVEKELIHYDILAALDSSGWLDRLTFQGGTCLRLCYGGVRYSEDLDFNVQESLTAIDLAGFAECLTQGLGSRYSVGVRVRPPTKVTPFEGGGELKRWQVVVDTAPSRADLPSQKIKIEIVHIPAYTRTRRLLAVNYSEIPASLGNTLVTCQTIDEILADKIVSFANARNYPRYRDLWDIPWIAGKSPCDINEIARMVALKHADYRCDVSLEELLRLGEERSTVLGESQEFLDQMRRFVPAADFAATLGRQGYPQALAQKTAETYRGVLSALAGSRRV